MSLQVLLAEYPNYSARKVRGLAKNLQYLAGINSKEAKGIGADLLDYHLQSAKLETQLNDDVKLDDPAVAEIRGPEAEAHPDWERVNVTRTSEAIRALEKLNKGWEELMGPHMDMDPTIQSCKGIIFGDSFYTDRKVLQEQSDG